MTTALGLVFVVTLLVLRVIFLRKSDQAYERVAYTAPKVIYTEPKKEGWVSSKKEEIGACWKGPCPGHTSGPCTGDFARNPGETCPTFLCKGCNRWQPWCFGGSSDPRCDDCMVNEPEEPDLDV